MKKLTALFIILFLFPVLLQAQTTVDAKDIIKQINEGKVVNYENVEITGDLDFTQLDDFDYDRPRRSINKRNTRDRDDRRSGGIISRITRNFRDNDWGSTRTIWYNVTVPVSFKSCTFRGDVIGYYHDEWENETYNVVFHKDASFDGCIFRRESAFKYVKFYEKAGFSNTEFEEEALFKYTEFNSDVSFEKAKFHDVANFKYTDFPFEVNFKETFFRREARFKYTKFPRGVDFDNAEFRGFANFKYAELEDPVNLDKADFRGDMDFKYTKINGRSFSRYFLRRRDR